MRNRIGDAWRRLTSTSGWGCPGDGCSGVFSSPEKARDHAAIAKVIGRTQPATAHDVGPQRRARRARSQAAGQLRRQGRRAAR